MTDWDPVSKQPLFKSAAAQVALSHRGDGTPAPAPTTTGSRPMTPGIPATTGGVTALAGQETATAADRRGFR
jgi:hypothetical protein